MNELLRLLFSSCILLGVICFIAAAIAKLFSLDQDTCLVPFLIGILLVVFGIIFFGTADFCNGVGTTVVTQEVGYEFSYGGGKITTPIPMRARVTRRTPAPTVCNKPSVVKIEFYSDLNVKPEESASPSFVVSER